jgi:hypothetical protein
METIVFLIVLFLVLLEPESLSQNIISGILRRENIIIFSKTADDR